NKTSHKSLPFRRYPLVGWLAAGILLGSEAWHASTAVAAVQQPATDDPVTIAAPPEPDQAQSPATEGSGTASETPTTAGDNPDEPSGNAYSVELQTLKRSGDETSQLLRTALQPQRDRLKTYLAEATSTLKGLLKQVQQDPDNLTLQAEFENQLSEIMVEASARLEAYAKVGPACEAAVQSLRETIDKSQQGCSAKVTEATAEIDKWQKVEGSVDSRLRAIASRFQDAIADNQPLPAEINRDVEQLRVELHNSRLRRDVARQKLAACKRVAELLRVQKERLFDLETNLTVSFQLAAGQHRLLADISDFRLTQLDVLEVQAGLRELNKLSSGFDEQLKPLDDLRTLIFDEELNPELSPDGSPLPQRMNGSLFLKSLLNPPTPKETPSETARK
ncbi:MAG: hypothetical protein RLZZ458_812, partial [Planctomycetota bacterium]